MCPPDSGLQGEMGCEMQPGLASEAPDGLECAGPCDTKLTREELNWLTALAWGLLAEFEEHTEQCQASLEGPVIRCGPEWAVLIYVG